MDVELHTLETKVTFELSDPASADYYPCQNRHYKQFRALSRD